MKLQLSSLEFRTRNYIAEAESHALPRVRSDSHPLSPSPRLHSKTKVEDGDRADVEFSDPLRSGDANGSISNDFDGCLDVGNTVMESSVQTSLQEWTSFKRLLMQRYSGPSKMVSVSPISDAIIKGSKAAEKLSATMHQEALDDSYNFFEEGVKIITRQEYVSRLQELKDEIIRAWHANDRITSLKLSIKIARLLMDTSVLQFYPTVFVLAIDIMDMLGDMVWDRIKQKAEFAEDGSRLCFLPDNFNTNDICSDAKETCTNWFSRVGSIRDLLPRIYLELSILHCRRFLLDHPEKSLQRLVMMTRGIGDPLVSIYCRLYMIHCAEKLPLHDIGYLITSITDIQSLLRRPTSTDTDIYFKDNKRLLVTLIEPAIEYIMKCIFKDLSQRQLSGLLVELGLGSSQNNLVGNSPCVSIVLYHLLKELPSEFVSSRAVEILQFVECSNDYSFDQCLNYRLVGFRLCERRCGTDLYGAVIEYIIEVVNRYDCLDKYLKIVDAYLDIVISNHFGTYLDTILKGISERACKKWVTADDLTILQSILLKILSYFQDVKDVFSQNHFLDILDVMHGHSRNIINMNILNMATRFGRIYDPTTIQLLFEISQALHDSIDYSVMKYGDTQQISQLICRFICSVDFRAELEGHLTFLLECRGAFGSINEVQEVIVHSSNCLVVKALKNSKRRSSFVKSCIACSEVTIPSIASHLRQLNLYLETAEVSLLGGLVSHADGLLDSTLSCLQSLISLDGSQTPGDLDGVLSLIQKICSVLVMVPGNPKKGVSYLPMSILSMVESQSWLTPKMKARAYCAIVSLCASLSQTKLPYRAGCMKVMGNDILFFNDQSYLCELVSLSDKALHKLLDVIQQEPSKAVRGTMALEVCNSIITTLNINDEVLSLCSILIDIAKSCMTYRDGYFQSTKKFLDRLSASSLVEVSIISI